MSKDLSNVCACMCACVRACVRMYLILLSVWLWVPKSLVILNSTYPPYFVDCVVDYTVYKTTLYLFFGSYCIVL